MSQEAFSDDDLAQAHNVIEHQKQIIEGLERRLEDARHLDTLRDIYSLAVSAKTIADPITHHRLLDMIVQTAATVMSARAASLFIIDTKAQELVFEVATGPKAAEVSQYRLPLGHGIAGFVAVSGQPIAITNVGNNPLHASDISRSIGYVPENILCVPLFYQDQVIGVLELLDKENGTPFDERDMNLVGFFANQAAIAIELSHTHHYLMRLFSDLFQSNDQGVAHSHEQILQRARSFCERMEEDTSVKRAVEFATFLQDIVWSGDDERTLCRTVLQSMGLYLRSRLTPLHEWTA
ncbi:MAG TPA: GAF domain-containing protein [Ktedonobacteraceae bacterium]|nr:GAF domain-containing protein [Ktedonobacteraceae bacterium]